MSRTRTSARGSAASMTWASLISAPSPRTLTTRTPIRGGPGNNPGERARYRNRARIAPISGKTRYLAEDKEADYLFTAVKDNQPGVFAALDALDWENAPVRHTAHHRGHGRDETRTLQVLPAPEGLFPCAAQAFLIERTVRGPHDGQLRSAVTALGITSRGLQRGGTPAVIAAAVRGHWDIEVLHYACDVTMREDAQRLRAGHQPRSWPPSVTLP